MVGGGENKQRLAAILAADAAGYSLLMAVDDQATVATLDAARAVFRSHIESNQGRVIDMAGDSVLAVFETAAGAVTAALEIQQALQASTNALPENSRMPFRIGVHLGDVIEKTDGTVYGDGVNIAARQAEMVLKLNPDFNLSGWRWIRTYKSATDRQHLYDAAKRAGIPEYPRAGKPTSF